MNIRARKGVVVATGGSAGNSEFRTMFDVRLTEEYQAENSEWTQRTADGEIAAMEIGAALGATACQTTQDDNLLNKGRMGKKSNGSATELYRDRAAFLPRPRHRARGAGLPERHPGQGERPALLHRDRGTRATTSITRPRSPGPAIRRR